ncbi:response regulator [Brumicola blandensis]|uniref:histidine kinase n=1 Tax=Brumicola blandensis TaxID=3075611 RepID=A0AAW8R0X7_9ALTE|nr:response regulator [Alteromonas sp. W409]MDT0582842.1 response regulator [Alteromonas sp. W409]
MFLAPSDRFMKVIHDTALVGLSFFIFLFLHFVAHANESGMQAQEQQYQFVGQPLITVYPPNEHGGHNQNWTSIQDKKGFIYVGHTSGISMWDGSSWSNISTPHATPVREIAEWQGELYLGTTNDIAKVSISAAGKLKYTSLLAQYLPNIEEFGEIWSTRSNEHGVLFVSSQFTFFYDGKKLRIVEGAISSKHFIFNIDNEFWYKAKNDQHINKITTHVEQDNIILNHQTLPYTLSSESRVTQILQDKNQKIVFVTESHGVYRLEDTDLLQVLNPSDFPKDTQLYRAIFSSDGYFYITTVYHGLFVLDENLHFLRNYIESDISMNTVFSAQEDRQGNIWLTGIPNIIKMTPAHIISQFKIGNRSTEILRLKETSRGILAAGNGIFKLSASANKLLSPQFLPLSDNQESSVDIIEFKDALVHAKWSGIFELEVNKQSPSHIEQHSSTALNYDARNTLNDILSTRQGKQLVAAGLGRIMQIDPLSGKLIASSSDGAFILDKTKNGVWQKQAILGTNDQLISLQIDESGTLFMGTATGELYYLEQVGLLGDKAELIKLTEQDGLFAGPVELFNIDNTIIISSGGELFSFDGNVLQRYRSSLFTDQWLSDNEAIDKIVQSGALSDGIVGQNERIWYRKNGKSGYFERQDNNQDLSLDNWLEKSIIFDFVPDGGFSDLFITKDGVLWFIRDKGEVYRVNIAKAEQLPNIASVHIRSINRSGEHLDFEKVALQERFLSLLPEQTNLRFSYTSSDHYSAKPILYRTRMAKINDLSATEPTYSASPTWSKWSLETYRDFNELSPASYLFEVEAKDAFGRVTKTEYPLLVLAPWYATPFAIAIFTFLVISLFVLFAYLVQKWRLAQLREKNRFLESIVKERTADVNQKVEQLKHQQILKDRFFSNVSHEFRTPLTLTIGPLEEIVSEHKAEISKDVQYLATTALNNASKMLALVGQVLDLNRLEAGKLPIRVAQHDISMLLRSLQERFDLWAKQHHQTLTTSNCEEPLLLWFDIDQIEKCVSNLLSNAIKYAGEHCEINIDLQIDSRHRKAVISVIDNGKGISEEARDKVFERFYQDKSSEQHTEPGTGIGLALVKEIMHLHQGEVRLVDKQEPGCCFTLELQLGNAHFSSEQIIEPIDIHLHEATGANANQTKTTVPASLESGPFSQPKPKDTSEDRTTLLVVDDNDELLNFISLRLSASYRILQAKNGKDALKLIQHTLPDLIISDVSMPVMDGLQLTESVKKNPETQTIPVILLTAKATKRETVEGFAVGADDYLTKPFDTSELVMRVNAQINARKQVRDSLPISYSSKPAQNTHNAFQEKVQLEINQQLASPSFNVESLAASLFMSRDTLIRKCKKEFGETPLNLIVMHRMQKAHDLLNQHTLSISEVAYACGFESLAYFSRSFKKHFGISPSQSNKIS